MRLGVDLGGTKVEIVALDDSGVERLRRRVDTPASDYEATLASIAALVEHAERTLQCADCSIGVGIPGSPSPATGLIRNANSTWLNGRPLQRDLERRLGRPVRIANDANCFALSEAVDGAGRDARVVFGVILGTGVGGGIVIEGRVLEGANAIAGEWGHNRLPGAGTNPDHGVADPLPRCWCGRDGCVETFLSGPALAAEHRRLTGQSLSAAAIAAAAQAGNAACAATLGR
ncbi:MAG: ROK family protein, partial [Burkholderiales bacterium]